jgi:16S rRNA A1518/A1519 N6-dimethyltransferase RsmA/KsgA/DIM1 with predicted DNA glycosylase/AP lyase activity
MMMKLLHEDWLERQLEHAFAALNIPLKIRAEALSREQFVELARRLHDSSGS